MDPDQADDDCPGGRRADLDRTTADSEAVVDAD